MLNMRGVILKELVELSEEEVVRLYTFLFLFPVRLSVFDIFGVIVELEERLSLM